MRLTASRDVCAGRRAFDAVELHGGTRAEDARQLDQSLELPAGAHPVPQAFVVANLGGIGIGVRSWTMVVHHDLMIRDLTLFPTFQTISDPISPFHISFFYQRAFPLNSARFVKGFSVTGRHWRALPVIEVAHQ